MTELRDQVEVDEDAAKRKITWYVAAGAPELGAMSPPDLSFRETGDQMKDEWERTQPPEWAKPLIAGFIAAMAAAAQG